MGKNRREITEQVAEEQRVVREYIQYLIGQTVERSKFVKDTEITTLRLDDSGKKWEFCVEFRLKASATGRNVSKIFLGAMSYFGYDETQAFMHEFPTVSFWSSMDPAKALDHKHREEEKAS